MKAGDISSKISNCSTCPDVIELKKTLNLYKHFITIDGKNFFDLTERVMDLALNMNYDLRIHQMFKRPDMQLKADHSNYCNN